MNNLISKFGQRERILLGIVFLALEVAAFYHFLIKPKSNDIRVRQTELSGREKLLESKKSKLRLLNQLETERKALKAQSDELRNQFFSLADMYDFLKRFIQYADKNDSELIVVNYEHKKDEKRNRQEIKFKSRIGEARRRNGAADKKSKKQADAEKNNISLHSVEVTIRGDYDNLINILAQLETYEKLTSISDLKILYSREEASKLEAQVTLELHLIDHDKKSSTPNSILSNTRKSKAPSRSL